MCEFEQFESELYSEFSEIFDKELPTRIREEKKRAVGNVLHSVASLLIPWYSPESYKEIIVSGLKLAEKKETEKTVNSKHRVFVTLNESFAENVHTMTTLRPHRVLAK